MGLHSAGGVILGAKALSLQIWEQLATSVLEGITPAQSRLMVLLSAGDLITEVKARFLLIKARLAA